MRIRPKFQDSTLEPIPSPVQVIIKQQVEPMSPEMPQKIVSEVELQIATTFRQ